ncbi:MAG: ATP-binding domain-containing protein [Myxococcales bacterium]|nr:ATP-binding domain-containing protein [Myxococcales bacterium]
MTIHSAKGLEFQRVYLTGMEERVFPHARVLDDPAQMEEERRLAYVAVTRAKRRLTITWTQMRRLYGQAQVGTSRASSARSRRARPRAWSRQRRRSRRGRRWARAGRR